METVKGENMTAEERHKLLSPEEKKIYWHHQKEKKLYKNLVPHYYNAKYGQDAAEVPKVELRSEKVRNIIGQVPPGLLRYGIMIIGGALLILIGVSAFIPYQPCIDVKITVTQTDESILHYSIRIPRSAMKNRAKFTEVVLNSSSEMPLPTRFEVESISDVVEVSEQNAWQSATLIPMDNICENILLDKPVSVPGKILFEKQSVMMWVVGKVK